jgi:structural maintenance of chromosome 3 (chondroitin sulfate proteoglycan 6)
MLHLWQPQVIAVVDLSTHIVLQRTAGNRLFHIVVDTDDTATRCIDELKRRKTGRLTFLPLNTIQPQVVHVEDSDFWPASRALRFDSSLQKAVDAVWGKTFFAKNAETCKRGTREFGIECVTMAGDLVRTR